MPKSSFTCIWALLVALGSNANAQKAPSSETLVLSLKTMSKALAGCREAYTWAAPGASLPLIKQVIGQDGYDKTAKSLDRAANFTKFLIEHPDQITGGMLVAILSTSDDFSVGVGSTRFEILQGLINKDSKINPAMAEHLVPTNFNLGSCQKSLFNAGDDYAGLVMEFVAAEDRLVKGSKPR